MEDKENKGSNLLKKAKKTGDQIKKYSTVCSNAVINFISTYWFYLALAAVVILNLLLNIRVYGYVSGDMNSFLIPWYRNFYENGIRNSLATMIGDYTPSYLYFMALISLFRVNPDSMSYVYALKTVSLVFEYGSAVLILFMALKISKDNKLLALLSFSLSLFAPTIFLNSGFWGQCDAIYSFFLVLALFLLIYNHPSWAFFVTGISFSFKLQSVFFFPFLLYVILNKKAKWRHILWIPVAYILMMLPSVFCGRSFSEVMGVYFRQSGSYPYLTLNAPTVYTFISNTGSQHVSSNALLNGVTFFGLAMTGLAFVFIYVKKKDPDVKDLIEIAYLFALLVPFVLPRMHERYFYLADIFACAMLIVNPKKFYIPLLSLTGSLSGYITYLTDVRWIDNDTSATLRLGALLIGAAIILTLVDLSKKPVIKEDIKES